MWLKGKEVNAMRKGLIATLVLTLVLGLVGYTLAQQAPHNPGRGNT